MSRKRWTGLVAGVAVTAGLAACGGSGGATETDAEPADTTTTLPSPAATGTLGGYTEPEITAYEEAVAALKRNVRVGLKVYRRGKATPAARRALASIYTGDELADEWESLREMEAEGGYLRGSATVVWTKPTRILVNDRAGTVDLRACVDRHRIRAYERGKGKIGRPDAARKAVFEVTVDLGSDGTWRVSDGEETGRC